MSNATAGRTASAARPFACPPWCVVDHGDTPTEDVFHRSEFAWLRPDGSLSGDEGPWEVAAQLVVPEDAGLEPTIAVDLGESLGPYAELTLETADQFIRDLKVFTARVQQMRDQLAAATGRGA